MSKPLVIVESPTKVRTLKKYLGKKYNVTATAGHIKDLPPKEIGIDIENDFKAKYQNLTGKQKVIKEIKSIAGDAKEFFLAPDPDREGEAIAFHISEILKKKGRIFHRILIHELTKTGIAEALASPFELDRPKYDAQQTRRILDRLVGYQISPLLWRKVQGGLSAGRVQSVSVKIICDRERVIHAFIPVEYWTVTIDLEGDKPPIFISKLAKKDGKKIEIPDGESAEKVKSDLDAAEFIIEKITKRTTKRNPQPPFITSKLQQDSINKLKFSARKTMSVAQQLYEGIDLGPGEPVGLITYMRTDSVRVADEAANEALEYIKETYGNEYAIDKPREFKNKNKSQDAHEAIRPTSAYHSPEKIGSFLTEDQLKLYTLIWRRFLSSQMTQALIDQNSIAIKAGDYTCTVSGSSVKFPGFMALYLSDEDEKEKKKKKQELPELKEGMVLKRHKVNPKQHFTMPPPRFSEASLVKELEENGIGRPSTYATILTTIRDKGYVDLVNKYFRPSELGFLVNDLLVESFPDVLDVAFTAKLEEDLDKVETNDIEYTKVLKQFYGPFEKKLETAKADMLSIKGVGAETELTCPDCKKEKLHIKVGRNGHFLACNGYPDCSYSRNYTRDEKGIIHPVEPSHEIAEGKFCEKCGSQLVIRQGRYGEFLACSGYPNCKNTISVHMLDNGNSQKIGVKCSEKGCDGEIVERKSKRGKLFFGCNNYPECTFASWDKPVDKPCPKCKAPFVVEKTTKKEGTFLKCNNKDCDYKEIL